MNLLVIDATGNVGDFEYDVSQQIFEYLCGNNVPITGNRVYQPVSFNEFANIFNEAGEYDAVFFSAHGDKPDSDDYNNFAVNNELSLWGLLRDWIGRIDKPLFLCCCYGFNNGTIQALAESDVLASPLVAPNDTLSKEEAEVFFCEVLRIICAQPSIDSETQRIEYIRQIVSENNHLASNKMQVFPYEQ